MPPVPRASDGLSEGTPSQPESARTTYRVYPQQALKVVCHRRFGGSEQYLVRWRRHPSEKSRLKPETSVYSWHNLDELWSCLHLVQIYVENIQRSIRSQRRQNGLKMNGLEQPISRKRKSPDSDPIHDLPRGRDGSLSVSQRREQSVVSISSSNDTTTTSTQVKTPEIYYGILQRKAGWLTSKSVPLQNGNVARRLPTSAMLEEAATTRTSQAVRAIRQRFTEMLKDTKGVYLINDIDTATPSLDFRFIDKYVLRDGVEKVSEDFVSGCSKCKPNMGQNIGCEYTWCDCLEYAAVDEDKLQRKAGDEYTLYKRQLDRGETPDTSDLPKRFPYRRRTATTPAVLQTFYSESRHPIYECNARCKCGPVCKSRLVQKGRQVELTIFKTRNRGWGVYCNEDLIRGEFIDTYLGEVLTNEETERRETKGGKDKGSYLYSLDKFVGDMPGLTEDTCYVVDGQFMGNATRFMNHSCEPNCRQYTVSYNKHDIKIYDLAFFAYEDIPAGTELTFDYLDKDEEEEEEVVRKRAEAARDPRNMDKKPCNCGAAKCRGYLWV